MKCKLCGRWFRDIYKLSSHACTESGYTPDTEDRFDEQWLGELGEIEVTINAVYENAYDKEVLRQKRNEGGLNKLIEPCRLGFIGTDGTGNHGTFSNLVFSDGIPGRRTYVYPCTNHWRLYYDNDWSFECVVVGKDRLRIMPGTWIDKWEVKGSKGDLWVVAKKLDGTYGCSCPGWKFKKAPKPNCKHIRAIITAMNMGIVPASKLKSNVTENREQVVKARIGEYKCGVCGSRFASPGNLNAHMMGIHGSYNGAPFPTEYREEPEVQAEVDHEFFQVKRKFRFED